MCKEDIYLKKWDVNLDIRTKEKKNVERDCTKETY